MTQNLGNAIQSAPGTDDPAILDELARAYEELHLLHGLAGALEDEIDHRLIFQKIILCLKELLPVERAEVWVPHRDSREYRCLLHYNGRQVCPNPEAVALDPSFEESLLGMGVRVLREKHDANDPLDMLLLRMADGMGLPAIAVPLLSKSRLMGLFLVRIPATLESLDASRLQLVAAAARQTSLSIHLHLLVEELRSGEGLRREIEIARQIQHGLLPQSTPQSPAFDLFGGCVTAARVGGDYYDFFLDDGGKLGLLIADVAGHSVASGLIAMSFRSSFRLLRGQKMEHAALFEKVNAALHDELRPSGSFLSAFYGVLDPEQHLFHYVNAGHNPPILWQGATKQCRLLEKSGLLIGILPEQKYSLAQVRVEPGDILLLYTDGILEAENQRGEFFGMNRLEEAIRKNARKSAREIYHYLLKDMYLFQDEHFNKDDVTMIVLKATGSTRGT